MSLLTNQQKLDIRNAIKLVTDTFFVTPVEYRHIGASIDRFQEDRGDRLKATYNLKAMVEYPTGSVKEETGGAIDTASVKVTFNMDDLTQVSGLVDANYQVIFSPTKDYMLINGVLYQNKYVMYDGALEQKNVLVIVYADIKEDIG